MGDDDPDIAPGLVPLRETLMAMVDRPVNIQASRDIVLQFRGDLLGQPYLTLLQTLTPCPSALLTYNIRVRRRGPDRGAGARDHRGLRPDLVLLQEATDPALIEQLAR